MYKKRFFGFNLSKARALMNEINDLKRKRVYYLGRNNLVKVAQLDAEIKEKYVKLDALKVN